MTASSIFRTPIFWIGFIILSFLGFGYAFYFFPKAIPIVNINITTDREEAINLAEHCAKQFQWGPDDPTDAVSFVTDSKAQTFVEWAGGGQAVFIDMIKNGYYMPYTWHVRRFKEFETNETHIFLTPEGRLYGFREKIPETELLPELSKEHALLAVMHMLQAEMHVNMSPYTLVEEGKHVQLNGRIDRTFVFERSDVVLNEGRYRIKAIVRGDKVTRVKQFINIPQSFTLKYKEMRSANRGIANAASFFSFIFYLLIGCLFGIFILMRLNWIVWQPAVLWALLIAFLQTLNTFNALPLFLMEYQTYNDLYSFYLNIFVQAFSSFVITFIFIALILIAAESLTRKAFSSHVRLWESWRPQIANSYTLFGYTLTSYLLIAFDMAFLVTFYYIMTTYFNWWMPLTQLANSNVLAYYFPCLEPIASSLQAGFREEAQYRAIPLASAALLDKRFGTKHRFLFVAFIAQAIIFGAVHANYPTQPAYARLVELIVPSFLFAGLYLRFGLLVSVIMHYAYDVFWMALPIFISHGLYIRFNQVAILFFCFFPLVIILYRRLREGTWQELQPEAYNKTWQPTGHSPVTQTRREKAIDVPLSRNKKVILFTSALCSLIFLLFAGRYSSDAPPLKIGRKSAIDLARKMFEEKNIALEDFSPYAKLKATLEKNNTKDLSHRYIWQIYQYAVYHKLMGSFLNPPHWLVRFLKFSGTHAERAESYECIIGAESSEKDPTYGVLSWKHIVAQSIPGSQLSKKEARELARTIADREGIDLSDMDEVSAVPERLPERTDWTFSFANTKNEPVNEGEARVIVTLAGDQRASVRRAIHIPEKWTRDENKEEATTNAVQMLCMLLIQILCIGGFCIMLMLLALKRISGRTFVTSFCIFAGLYCIRLINYAPQLIAQFNTAEPFMHQLFKSYVSQSMYFLFQVLVFAALLSLIISTPRKFQGDSLISSMITGICTGIVACCTWSCLQFFMPSVAPLWGYYGSLGTQFPYLGFILVKVLTYLQYAAILTFGAMLLNYITHYGARYLAVGLILCILAGLCFAGFDAVETVSSWALTGSGFGIMFFVLWYAILHFTVEAIPIAVATCFTFAILQQIFFDVLPVILPISVISIIGIGAIALLLARSMREQHV